MIHIIDDFYLDSDENCFILMNWNGSTKIKNGKNVPNIKRRRYYLTLEKLFLGLHKMLSRRAVSKATSIDDFLSIYQNIEKTIKALINRNEALADFVSKSVRQSPAKAGQRV